MYKPTIIALAVMLLAGCTTTTEEVVEKKLYYIPLGYDAKDVGNLKTKVEPVADEKLKPVQKPNESYEEGFSYGMLFDVYIFSEEKLTREELEALRDACVKIIKEECTKRGMAVYYRNRQSKRGGY